ncbi:MAG: hypothetical protein Q8M26_15125 [Pseudolabrys sp.]|nr:hypothetical protein [Pseudolabrys sp.]
MTLLIRGALAAAALMFAIATPPAEAAPLSAAAMALAAPVTLDSQVLQVRDGCRRGYRYSYSRDRCVRDFDDRRGPPPVRRGPPVDPGVAIMQGIIGGAVAPRGRPGCPRNMRWSDRRGQCVYN